MCINITVGNVISEVSYTCLTAVWWWGAGKADKGGVQAGEAGLTKRCSQLETALLQGLQQVISVQSCYDTPLITCMKRGLPKGTNLPAACCDNRDLAAGAGPHPDMISDPDPNPDPDPDVTECTSVGWTAAWLEGQIIITAIIFKISTADARWLGPGSSQVHTPAISCLQASLSLASFYGFSL